MKRLLFAAALAAAAVPALATDVGVSVNIGQPGFYGQINIGNAPPPQLIYPQPLIIQQPRVVGRPIYLRVPPGHAKNWRKHCGRYNACGRPVYFVQDNWYNQVYAPRYRETHRDSYRDNNYRSDDRRDYRVQRDDRGERHGAMEQRGRDHEPRNGNGHGRGRDQEQRHDNGNGHGNGRGHDKNRD